MADIKKELNDIKTAIYGKDVRGSIHDGIDKINKESEDSKQKASEAHDVMESIINDGFDNAALEANFEQKLDDKIGQLQPEWTQFQTDVTSQLNETEDELFKSSHVNHKVGGFNLWWIDDDGHKGVYTKLAPWLREYGIKMSSAIITDRPHGFPIPGLPAYNPSGLYMSYEQMKELEDEGIVEFIPHSHTHDLNNRYTDMSVGEIHDDMSTCKKIMRQLGWNYKDLVFPFGAHNDQVREVARQYFRSAIDTKGGAFIPPVDQFSIPRIGMDTIDSQSIISEINKAYENDTLIILMSHVDQYGGLEESKMREVIEHALSLGGRFITGEEAINNYGNIAQFNNTIISYDGGIHSDVLNNVIFSKVGDYVNNAPITDFPIRKTVYVKVRLADVSDYDFPPSIERHGMIEVYRDAELGYSYQTFIPSNSRPVLYRNWNTVSDKWGDWQPTGTTRIVGIDGYENNAPITAFPRHVFTNVKVRSFDLVHFDLPSSAGYGIVETYRDTETVYSYQKFTSTSGGYVTTMSRKWNSSTNSWTDWRFDPYYIGDARITVNETVAARGTINKTLNLGSINLDQKVSVQPEGALSNGLIPYVYVSSPGVITLKINNITESPIAINSQVFKIQRLQY